MLVGGIINLRPTTLLIHTSKTNPFGNSKMNLLSLDCAIWLSSLFMDRISLNTFASPSCELKALIVFCARSSKLALERQQHKHADTMARQTLILQDVAVTISRPRRFLQSPRKPLKLRILYDDTLSRYDYSLL